MMAAVKRKKQTAKTTRSNKNSSSNERSVQKKEWSWKYFVVPLITFVLVGIIWYRNSDQKENIKIDKQTEKNQHKEEAMKSIYFIFHLYIVSLLGPFKILKILNS